MGSNRLSNLFTSARNRLSQDREYYSMTILSPEDGTAQWSLATHWVGWVDNTPPHEMREGSIVVADRMADFWESKSELYHVVNSASDLGVFLLEGGHALVEQAIALEYLPDFVGPNASTRDGPFGFKYLDGIDKRAFNRAPSRKQRMRIFKRDGFRCRICGRRPADSTDIELHIHHIIPWGKGGLTEDDNLLTACHTCHGGLDPHEERALFNLIDEKGKWRLGKDAATYYEAVLRYRRRTAECTSRCTIDTTMTW